MINGLVCISLREFDEYLNFNHFLKGENNLGGVKYELKDRESIINNIPKPFISYTPEVDPKIKRKLSGYKTKAAREAKLYMEAAFDYIASVEESEDRTINAFEFIDLEHCLKMTKYEIDAILRNDYEDRRPSFYI